MIVSLIISYIPFGSFPVYKILNKEYVQIDSFFVPLRIPNFIKHAV